MNKLKDELNQKNEEIKTLVFLEILELINIR